MMSDIFASRRLRALCAIGLAGALSACASPAPPPRQQAYVPPPPLAPPPVAPPAVQPPAVQPYDQPQVKTPMRRRSEQQVAVRGTAFPVDGTQGRVPPGSRLVVRVYDAAGGDVNIRVAEDMFGVEEGIPARYEIAAPARSLKNMGLPAVAARVEGPRGRVIYRNETAVLLKSGKAGDIPMTRQRVQAASTAATPDWATPPTE